MGIGSSQIISAALDGRKVAGIFRIQRRWRSTGSVIAKKRASLVLNALDTGLDEPVHGGIENSRRIRG